MRTRVFLSFLLAATAAVALVSASGAATAKAQKVAAINVSTRETIVHYLHSIHVGSKGLVVQRGIRNYAGAHCPGSGWTCTSTSHPVVQVAKAGGTNTFSCATKSCAVVQVAASALATNTAKCIKLGGLAPQSCTINQSSSTGNNVAIVYQLAVGALARTQTASVTASITQKATGAANTNTACVSQNVLMDGSTAAIQPVTVALEAHQTLTIQQDSSHGGNSARSSATALGACDTAHPLTQNQVLNSVAVGHASVTQNENAANNGPNMTIDIEQNQSPLFLGTAHGPNTANFNQTNSLTAVADTPSGPVSQTQSSVDGGLLGTINQDSRDLSTATATQTETQCEDARTSTSAKCDHATSDPPSYSLTQTQFGPVHKGVGTATQTGNTGDTFNVNQSSTQDDDQGSGSHQTNVVQGDCSTSGTSPTACTVTQNTNVDGHQNTNTQSGQDVNTTTTCTGSECTVVQPPSIDAHPPNPSNVSSAEFAFSDTQEGVTFLCQLDDNGYSPCSSPQDYSELSDGSHTFSVEAKDGAGNVSDPTSYTWTVATNAVTVLQLNPASDPEGGTCQDSFASGTGFDGVPQEVHETADLSQFDGQPIQLRFSFSTQDSQFNAFEGWYVKNIQVTGTTGESPVTVFSDPVADGDTQFTAASDFGVAPGWHVTDRRTDDLGGPSWWYGNETTGTYQSPNPIDSCSDNSANAGTITSGPFTLASNSQLSFDTLWQIEGVNPSGYDLMDVQVIPASVVTVTTKAP
jgi:hypothetical protein